MWFNGAMDGDEFELEAIRQRIMVAKHELFFDWERGTFANDTMCPKCLNLYWFKKDCHRCGGTGWIPMVNVDPDPAYL